MQSRRTLIIAEAGVNHNGSLDLAKEMIVRAASAGADYVKFQTFSSERLVSRFAGKAEYQVRNCPSRDCHQLAMLKELELGAGAHRELAGHATKNGIGFLSTPFDMQSIALLRSLNLDFWKIASGEITDLPHLQEIGSYGGHVILSTGMATLGEIESALSILTDAGTPRENITVLHCNTEYPTPREDVNLLAMIAIREAFRVNVGYSDHTLGIEIPIAAVALGASVIEKHFTLDPGMDGPDHRASLNPEEFGKMVVAIRNVEKGLGDGLKRPSPSEMKNRTAARKSIVAACHIARGQILDANNLTVKRPGNGVSPMSWPRILGKTASRDYDPDELIDE